MTRSFSLTCTAGGALIVAGVMAVSSPTSAQQKPADTALEDISGVLEEISSDV